MNQGARDANDQSRHLSERSHREATIRLLTEIRDLLRWHFRDDPIDPESRHIIGLARPPQDGAE